MAEKKEAKKPIYKMWQFWVGVAGVIILGPFVLSAMISGFMEGLNSADNSGAAESSIQIEAQTKSEPKKFTESDADSYCTDANLVGRYLDLHNVNILNFGTQVQTGEFSGWYDADGNPIIYTRWTGRNKTNDAEISFDCWVSGKTADKITLHKFNAGGVDFLNLTSTTVFDKDGVLVFADEAE